ncbi:hypothetical protein V2J09_017249 [Rumex salicifolius]
MVVGDRRIMRLLQEEGERAIVNENADEIMEKEIVSSSSYAIVKDIPHPLKIVVGYALTSKKTKSFLQPNLESVARLKGIAFTAIDITKPLSDQGPFDILLQKLSGKEWCQSLEDYRLAHPDVTILDPPHAIQHLRNRQTMLQDVDDLNLTNAHGTIGVPKQLVIKDDAPSIPSKVSTAGLSFPIVAKPLYADGSAKSHELSLAYDQYSLKKLEPPLVLQEFVNHGGVVFKVYVIGDAIKVVRRFSLPNITKHELSENAGVFNFPRVSCAAASADDADLDPDIGEHPPRPLLEKLAKELRRRLGLRLFNLDIIREHGSQNKFYVIDINYFPGYGKMPDYEHIFTDFLLRLVESKHKEAQRGLTRTISETKMLNSNMWISSSPFHSIALGNDTSIFKQQHQKHFLCTIEGPASSYSALAIHI